MTAGKRLAYHFDRALACALFRTFFRVQVTGRDRVQRQGGLLVVANHVSLADPPFLAVALPRRLEFMAAAELFRIPILGQWMSCVGAFGVDRSRFDAQATREAVRRLREGASVVMFPQGGIRDRSGATLGEAGELREGAAVVAHHARATVLPVILQHTPAVLQARGWLGRRPLLATVGRPFCFWVPASLPAAARSRARLQETLAAQLRATVPTKEPR